MCYDLWLYVGIIVCLSPRIAFHAINSFFTTAIAKSNTNIFVFFIIMSDLSFSEDNVDLSKSFTGSGYVHHDDAEHERDEVEEVQRMARKDTCRVTTMRLVIAMLLVAAFVVTFVTFRLLQQEQHNSFEAAVSFQNTQ